MLLAKGFELLVVKEQGAAPNPEVVGVYRTKLLSCFLSNAGHTAGSVNQDKEEYRRPISGPVT